MSSTQLPYGHLESLRSKATQIIESIQSLHQILALDQPQIPYMPPWPEILAKYNLLLSQTHSFSASLTPILSSSASAIQSNNNNQSFSPYERLALHPTGPLSDPQLDTELVPLLRNQQTNDVLKMETDIVRRISENMTTKGSIGVLTSSSTKNRSRTYKQPTTYQDVLNECNDIRSEHDKRADRAGRAVTMLRERFEWKARVEVEVEEPEELGWDPRLGAASSKDAPSTMDVDVEDEEEDEDEDDIANVTKVSDDSSDEQIVEGALASTGLTPA